MKNTSIKLNIIIGVLFILILVTNPMVIGLESRIENLEQNEETTTPNSNPLLIDPLQYIGSLTENIYNPSSVTVLSNGNVLVTDLIYNHIARFLADGTFIGTWSIPEGPIGIAVHPNGNYYIALRDENTVGIYTYDSNSDLLIRSDPGSLGEGDPQVDFIQPTDIDIATDTGRIYVVDAKCDKIYGFESNSTLQLIFGERGEQDDQFLYPSAIAVDETNSRLIVADHDNFRIKIFNTSGGFLQKFGYRIKYIPGQDPEGWMPRTQGLAVDSDGQIYVVDALMSTVRIFSSSGEELEKVVEYGYNPGNIQIPFDLALNDNESWLYCVSAGTSSIEIFETPNYAGRSGSEPIRTEPEDGSLDQTGTNQCDYDSSSKDSRLAYEGPHMIDSSIICGRCHSIGGQPGGHIGLLEGQTILCMSCHSGGGQALNMPILNKDLADPFGTNPSASDGLGRSHAWGVSAINADARSIGPTAGGVMESYLDTDGNIKCATCHDQHSNFYSPYLRMNNQADSMCKQCHAPLDQGPGEGDYHPVGFDYPGGIGEYPPDGDIVPSLLLKQGNVECMTCHAPHNADSGGVNDNAGDGMLIRVSNDETLCLICHTEHG